MANLSVNFVSVFSGVANNTYCAGGYGIVVLQWLGGTRWKSRVDKNGFLILGDILDEK